MWSEWWHFWNSISVWTQPGRKIKLSIGLNAYSILKKALEGYFKSKHFIFAYGTKMRKIEFKVLK